MSLFGLIGGAVSDIFGGIGDQKAASGYGKAARYADQEAELTKRSTAIELQQGMRKAYQIIGGQQSDIAGAGFAQSGSALDLLRSSRQQAALSNQLMSAQGLQAELGFRAEAESFRQQASASKTSSAGGFLSGALGIAGAIFSDRRLKKDIEPFDEYAGIKLYQFRYLWDGPDAPLTIGPMAQEIAVTHPHAVFSGNDGFLWIDYNLMDEAA